MSTVRALLDWKKVKPLELNASQTARLAELAPILEGKPDVSNIAQIDLERLAREFRTQKIIFEAARDVYEQMQKDWKGGKEALLAQLVRLVEQFIRSDKIAILPGALLSGRSQAPPHHYAQHDESRAAHLGGHPFREHRKAGAGL